MTATTLGKNLLAPMDAPLTGRGLSFGRLFWVEMRKQLDTRAGRGLLITIGLITALVIGISMWVGRKQGLSYDFLLAATVMPQGMLLPILGIVTICNEWSQRTALVTFTQEPRRVRVLTAKALAAMALGTGVLALTIALAALGHVVSMTAAGKSSEIALSMGWTGLFGGWVMQMLSVLQGVAFGALLMSVPIAVGAFFLVPTIWAIVTAVWSPLTKLGAWIDLSQAQAPLMAGDQLTLRQWEQLGTAGLIWIALPLALGIWRTVRREVK